MKNKILVTTDLSSNSKAGVRFAIQLAFQNKSSLCFYYCLELLKPTRWSKQKYQSYASQELETARRKLEQFVTRMLPPSKQPRAEYIVETKSKPSSAILKCATRIKAGAICMSTRGAGPLKKIVGTNASSILSSSPLPVFIVPSPYREAPISNIFFSSDLKSLGAELRKVKTFADSVNAKTLVFHYDPMLDVKDRKSKLLSIASRFKSKDVRFIFQKLNLDKPLVNHLFKDFRKFKASLAVLFTNQKRGWFDRLFSPSKTADISFNTKIPLLVYPKNN